MSSKYDHIQLGREFRDYVKPRLKAMAGWSDYVASQGWKGRTEALNRPELLAACEALGFDLVKAKSDWAAATSAAIIAAMPMRPKIEVEAALETALNDAPAMESIAPAPVGDGVESAERWEGGDVDTVIAEMLAPASAHMTPHLAQMMPGLIRPAVEAAVRGPRIVTKTIVQTVASDGAVVAPAMSVNAVKTLPLWQAFGSTRGAGPDSHRHVWQNLMVDVCDYVDPLNAIDLDYLWQPSLLAEIAAQDSGGMNAWLWGPAGTGKTEGVAQYAARLGRPFVRIAIERTTEPMELIGQMVPSKAGGMIWEDGKLTRAFRIPRAVILIDEPSLLRSGTLSVISVALDQRKLFLATGEVVPAAPGVFIIAADNTNGTGDDTGRYVDTAALNAAFLDRFAFKTELSFLTVAQETAMIARRVGVHPAAIKPMCEYASITRRDADAGKLTIGVTTRRLLNWARSVRIGVNSKQAFEGIVLASAAPEDKATLLMLAGQNLASSHALIDDIVRGRHNPDAPPVITPPPAPSATVSAVAGDFPDETL